MASPHLEGGKLIILLMLPFLFGNFVQKWYFPQGVSGFGNTRMQILDTDRDESLEFVFTTYGSWPAYIYFYELHLPDVWEVDSVLLSGGDLLWNSGDFDGDGLYDLALQFHIENPSLADGIMIYESPDSFFYPTQEVWRDTVGFALVQPISVCDVDQDSFPEIFKLGWRKEDSITTYYPFGIYESVGDNQYDTIFMGTGLGSLSSTIAFGDFDSDGLNEFVIGNIDGKYQLWECMGNNNYQLLAQQQLPTVNIKDCFSVPDADEDGKLEFVVKGFWVYGAIDAFIFEATGDNIYEIIDTFALPGGDYYGGYSAAGDVDGDSIPEIVLEARQNVFIIKAAGDDSFYIWDTLPGHASGSCVRIFDIDDNGLSEVVISGENETRIYEFEGNRIREDVALVTPQDNFLLFPNPFKNKVTVRYALGKQTHVTMTVYDACGRHVKTLVSESQQAGYYSQFWDGFDDHGSSIPAGIYFVRMKANGYKTREKVLLIK